MTLTLVPELSERGLRPLPANIEAEQALLGAVLLQPKALDHVAGLLRGEHFSLPVHCRIYDAALALASRGAPINVISLRHYFEDDEALSEAGGAQYLARLAGSAVTIINAQHYGRTIVELAARRTMIALANQTIERAFAPTPDDDAIAVAGDAIGAMDRVLDDLQGGGAAASTLGAAVADAMLDAEAARDAGGAITGVPTGISALDELLGGLHAGELIVVGARPGMGKTALGLGVAVHAAERGCNTLFISLEMMARLLGQRQIAMATGIPITRLRKGALSQDEWHRAMRARDDTAALPLEINDAPRGLTMQAIAAAARRANGKARLGLILVDYLQMILPSEVASRRNRVDEITEISAGLKRLAKELSLPVIALAQLNRGLEARDNKRPGLSDLRDSGSIEQDADVIIFLHREIEYLRRKKPDQGDAAARADWDRDCARMARVAELIVAKHRQGSPDVIICDFDPVRTLFCDPGGRV